MNLIMITRKIDPGDPRVGFVSEWVEALSAKVDTLHLLTWHTGNAKGLPKNVTITELPTEAPLIKKILLFKRDLKKVIKNHDGVFCHQMPEYTILAAPTTKIHKKKLVSWYTHGAVTLKMKIMLALADSVLTASKESCRVKSKKVKVIGHGINTDKFKPQNQESRIPPSPRLRRTGKNQELRIVTIGRISPTKDIESMIKALYILDEEDIKNIHLEIIGDVGLKRHRPYLESLSQMIGSMNLEKRVRLVGPITHEEVPQRLQEANIFINLSGTGSLDKAALEAIASGCLVFTSNEAFKDILPSELMVEKNNPHGLAKKIKWIRALGQERREKIQKETRSIVVSHHNLSNLAKKIVDEFKS